MTRAKVPLDARQRVVSACRRCKESKRKCDASLPCAYCVKRGMADTCESSGPTKGKRASARVSKTRPTSSISLNLPRGSSLGADINDRHTQDPITPHVPDSTVIEPVNTAENKDDTAAGSPSTTRAHMLSQNQGEQVYIGRYASLSFLQLIRETVTRCIGPSEFSEYADRDQMLEVNHQSCTGLDIDISLKPTQEQECITNFNIATSGLCYVLTCSEVESLLTMTSGNQSNVTALRLLVIAIGAQCGTITDLDQVHYARMAFIQAREIAFSDRLENLSLDLVRVFLLMSFYMLGACHRNAAYMYLGIAARAAHALGLHTAESYKHLSQDKRHAQLRCWKSLVSLDLIVSSILGRSAATSPQHSGEDHMARIVDTFDKESRAESEAIYRLALLVDSIAGQFNEPHTVLIEAARSHLQTLKRWVNNLPERLRPHAASFSNTSSTAQSLVGCLHVSCFYYFVIMLLTRPFLIVCAIENLAGRKDSPMKQLDLQKPEGAEELSSICLNAATYMAQTCSDALHLGLLAENMCLVKAWIFAAGLVLGFQLFACNEHDEDTENAFSECREVLSKFAGRSPQAAQYRNIMDHLYSAVIKHRQVLRSRKQSRTADLLERVMSLRDNNDPDPMSEARITNEIASQLSTLNATQAATLYDTSLLHAQFLPTNVDHSLSELDNFLLSSDDSFVYNLQSFGTMPWDVA